MFYASVILITLSVLFGFLFSYKKRFNLFEWVKHALYPSCLKEISSEIFLPSVEDENLEEGKEALKDENDNMMFIGVDGRGNHIVAKISCLRKEASELFIALCLSDGSVYSKKCETSKTGGKWSAGCLQFELIEPMKIWRISFNGSVRSAANANLHVRINLIWRSFCRPYVYQENDPESSITNLKIELSKNGYEQWGAIVGEIIIGSVNYNNMHFVSLRQRYWGSEKWSNIVGFCDDGILFSVGVSHKLSKRFGHIRFPKGFTSKITGDFPEFTSITSLPDDLEFKLLGNVDPLVKATLDSKTNLYSTNLSMVTFDGYCDEISCRGFIQIWDCYTSEDMITENIREAEEKESDVLLLPLESPLCSNVQLVGGKGASLALLTALESSVSSKLKAIVPQGFCLTKMAMNLQIQSSRELSAAIRTLILDVYLPDLTQICQRIQEVWLSTKVCAEIKYILSLQIDNNVPYAIRSSGLSEDTKTLSSAGQNATYLGCVGLESILLAIQKCWASLYSFHSVQYRRMNGMSLKSNMGIVVQEMVAAEISGVMFTCDPLTGNPFETIINANYGLGETVVSATVEPDSIKLEKKENSSGDIEFLVASQKNGKKTHQLSMIANGLIVKMNLDDCSASVLCMSHEEAKTLAKIGLFLEKQFGSPCDIEWAVLNGVVYLLQCRPVTTLHTWSDNELLHEFDSALLLKDVTTTANTGEVLPGATSILSQSLIVRALDIAVSFHSNDNLDINDLYNNMNCITSSHHVFINVFNTLLSKIEEERTPAQTATELAVCGHVIFDDIIQKHAILRNGVLNDWTKVKTLLKTLNYMCWCSQVTKETEEEAVKFSIPYKDCLTAKELYELISQNLFLLEKVSRRHSFVSTVNVFWQVILLIILLEGEKDITNVHFEDVSRLFQCCSSVISAEIPSELEDISSKISECKNCEEFYNMPTNLAKHWIKVHSPEAAHLLSKFLIFHGHRSIRELDFCTETWGLNATSLFANLQNLVRCNISKKEKTNILSEFDIIKKLKTPKKLLTRTVLSIIFPFCRKSTEHREVSKNALLLVIHTFRIAFNQLGNLMARENILPQQNLIFFCTYYEIKKLLSSREPIILQKALRRQRLWEKWDRLKFPELMTSFPEPINLKKAYLIDGKARVKGTLVYPGQVESRACVLLNPKESSVVKAGDILITNSTDVGWSPIFPLLSGIVTELGGLISHGAVVAREYGIPCIVGATGATSLFKTGDEVALDGANSCVFKLREMTSEEILLKK